MPNPNRRSFLAASAMLGLGAAFAPRRILAQRDETERSAGEMVTRETQVAIDEGLAWLGGRQNEDGSFGSGGYGRNAAICSLAGMALMSSGSMPGRGPFGVHVEQCVRFILDSAQESGFIIHSGDHSHGPMYGHGFATMFLGEVYGMMPDSTVREALAKAVRLIIETQNGEGGWRYQPHRDEADLSVTICQVMALRAARNAGIFVPAETIDRCIEYVKRSQNPDGGFMYMIEGGPSAFPRSAAGVVALYSAGVYEGEEIENGLDYLMKHIPRTDAFERDTHYYYGHYYAVQAMWHAGGERWKRWFPAIREALLARRLDDGRWLDNISPEYGTSMALLILQMPNNYLPIFQR